MFHVVMLRYFAEMSDAQPGPRKPGYVWPWFLLAGFLLGVVLAVIWLTAEVRRVKERRQYNFTPPATTNSLNAP